jgi:hypothetical protein
MTLAGAQELAGLICRNNLSETVLGEIMDALPVAIYMTDAQGRRTYSIPLLRSFPGVRQKLVQINGVLPGKSFLRTGRLCRPISARWRLR